MARILTVDDEPALRVFLRRLLTSDGHVVTEAASAHEGLAAAREGEFDLILLDLLLPDLNGDEVLVRLLQANEHARVLVLSSVTDIPRRAKLLMGGAVDFLAKPFANAELLARINARIRDVPSAPTDTGIVEDAGLRLDVRRRELTVNGRRVDLSNREFVLLAHLLGKRGQVCSRRELLDSVWGLQFDPGTNVVDVYVARLRAKIRGQRIETVRNVGYRLAA